MPTPSLRRPLFAACATLLLSLMMGAAPAWAQQVPEVITYQGTLADADGNPVTDPVDLAFRFFDAESDGTPLPGGEGWSESYTGVAVTNGRFSVPLGSQTPLPDALFDNRQQLWLEVAVNGETLPRTRMTSTAFAREAQSVVDGAIGAGALADGAVTQSKLADETAVRSINGVTDEVLLSEGTNVTITQQDNELVISATGADGEPSVVAEAPLAGDGTGEAPLRIPDESIPTAKLADDAAVLSLNGRRGDVRLQGGSNVAVSEEDDTITITATGAAGVTSVEGLQGAIALAGDGVTVASDEEDTITLGLADEAVGSATVADNALTADDLDRDAVGEEELADEAVDAAAIQRGVVAAEKLNTANSPSDGNYLRFIDGEMRWTSLFSSSETDGSPSSIRWKENVRTLDDAVALVDQLRGVRYDWTESGEADVGVIAEEVAEVLPELVEFDESGRARAVHYARLTAVLIEATKAQQKTIKSKERTIHALRHEMDALEDRMARIERLLQSASGAAAAPPPGSDSPR
ncbi:MAG: hypothetical protein GVY35_09940 [Bacteroidetes bacterium]|jgi:hypothetical protein|nr:hypothetical protein [Bacteroidota bacterium]